MATVGNRSKYLAEQMGLWAFTAESVTRPTAWWAALMSVASTAETPGTEFDAGDYGRVAVVYDETGALTGVWKNTGNLAFGTPATDWPDCCQVVVMDAETDGNELLRYDVSPVVGCDAGSPVLIPISNLVQTST